MAKVFDREVERAEVLTLLSSQSKQKRQAIIDEYERRSLEAFAPETLRNLRQIKKSFARWCEGRAYDPMPPVAPEIVAEYVEALGGKLSANTIATRLWAISEHHRSLFLPSPCRHRLVELALKSVKRKYGAYTRQAPPLSKAEVLGVVLKLGVSRQELRDKALIWAASDSWCRVSELVAFQVRDMERQDDGSSLLFVRRSKTDPYGKGDYAFLSKGASLAVLAWIEAAGLKAEDPMFTKSQRGGKRTPLAAATVSRIIKRRFDRSDVSSHSMRVGGVHDAFRLNCSLSSIMVAGRWRSPEMPARYGRRILASQSAAAEVARAFESETVPLTDDVAD
ncbi:recombinase XerD [Gymnodinialimonas ceratoperidinii]|uniref:Recombinase XerD n=1 Tax=Gymnodinialimonas ceratoperidinii TaxID=2856823 RepID=A0A8F6YE29_9RHOB|nr:recombinase XerD [Gymnodinialimonas ceratoperidinii]QXT41155.1 recombinase XerD [Gymnodinialimonas ceratoperidinii]